MYMQAGRNARSIARSAAILLFTAVLGSAQYQNVGAVGRGVSISFQNASGSADRGVSVGFGLLGGTINITSSPTGAGFRLVGPGYNQLLTTPFTLTNATAGQWTVTWSILLGGYQTPAQETKTLPPGQTIGFTGTYTAVTLSACPTLSIRCSPTLSFFSQQGIAGPVLPQQVSVFSNGPAISFTATATTDPVDGPWLAAILPLNLTTPGTITVAVVPNKNLKAGTYSGKISVTSNDASDSPQTLDVSLTVTKGPAPPVSNSQLIFPLKADAPHIDKHFTAKTAPVNSIFDHSMADTKHAYHIYGCDSTVIAFTDTTAKGYDPQSVFGTQDCNNAYAIDSSATTQISLAPDMTYRGPNADNTHLYYDGHPGIDFHAGAKTEVYAAASGKVHYPPQIVGISSAASYHIMEIIPDHPSGTEPPYVIYYLHLATYVGQTQTTATDPSPSPGCQASVKVPIPEGQEVTAGCLVALVGNAAPPGVTISAHLHFEVHQIVSPSGVASLFGARKTTKCVDGAVSSDYDCVPIDPYGWNGSLQCDSSGMPLSGSDPYFCLTGIQNRWLWQ